MNDEKFKKQFQKRLLITVSLGLFFACITVAATSILPLYSHLKKQQKESLIFKVTTRTLNINFFLDKVLETSRQISSRSKAREALEKYNRKEISLPALQTFLEPILQDALQRSEFAVGITRLDHEGTAVLQTGLSVPNTFLKQNNPETFSNVSIREPVEINGKKYLIATSLIINRANARVGTDIILFDVTQLQEIVDNYTGMGETGEVVLGAVDKSGKPFWFFPLRKLPNLPVRKYRDIEIIKKSLEKVLTVNNDQKIRFSQTDHDIASFDRTESANWGVVFRINKTELYEPVFRQIKIVSAIIIFLIIPAGMVCLLFLLRPLSSRMIIHVAKLQKDNEAKEKAIRERVLAEQQLGYEKEQLLVTIRSIGDGIITTDREGKIVLINKITEAMTGWSQEEACGRPVQEVFNIIDEQSGEPCKNPVDMVLTLGKIITLANHTALISRDGIQQYSIEDSAAPISDNKSNIIGVVLVFRDVTDKKRMAEELIKIKKLESVGVLAGGIAHDFNNILTGILGNIELAQVSIKSDSPTYSLLNEAKKASIRAKSLTHQLLTFSKGGTPVKQTTTTINKIITDPTDFVLHGSPVSCVCNIPDDLWLVDIDPGQISQVIQNIVLNARHAMPNGGVVEIFCQNTELSHMQRPIPQGKYIKISISDSGVGIPAKHIDQIFDPYFSTKQEGNGLGLAICHSIISKHGGHIEVRSEMDKGTKFTIFLPASDNTEESPNVKKTETDIIGSQATIMIMDDEPMVRDLVNKMLTRLGHNVVMAENGQKAIELYTEYYNTNKELDIVIMDLTIPGGMGGKEAVQKILQINPDAVVVVSSGYFNDPVMADYEKFGFTASIGKPFQMADLYELINHLLKNK